jgi:alcohol dehydrogenase class IV
MSSWIQLPGPTIVAGPNCYEVLGNLITSGKVLIITSRTVAKLDNFRELCNALSHLEINIFDQVIPNPTPEDIDSSYAELKIFDPTDIVAIGGGSVIDFAKVISAKLSNSNVCSTIELVSLTEFRPTSIKLTAIPTTSGTGSEMTPFATVWPKSGSGKVSIESSEIKPSIVILDSELSRSASTDQLLFSGLDAISHCVETLWNRYKNPISEMYAVSGLKQMMRSFPRVIAGVGTFEDFENIQLGAMFGGQAISQNHTAIAHSVSYPLTAFSGVPHGLACSFTIPAIFRTLYLQSLNNRAVNELLEEVVAFLDSLILTEKVHAYCSQETITGYSNLFITQNRSNNFAVDIEIADLLKIIDVTFRAV